MSDIITVIRVKAVLLALNIKEKLSENKGEGFIDTVIKMLIAVVIGALLLGLLYALFKDTLFPKIEEKLKEMFDYNG